jgi:hypothetical protein
MTTQTHPDRWYQMDFRIDRILTGPDTVRGIVHDSLPFAIGSDIDHDGRYSLTILPLGRRIDRHGFTTIADARQFAAAITPLTDWFALGGAPLGILAPESLANEVHRLYQVISGRSYLDSECPNCEWMDRDAPDDED